MKHESFVINTKSTLLSRKLLLCQSRSHLGASRPERGNRAGGATAVQKVSPSHHWPSCCLGACNCVKTFSAPPKVPP